MMRASCCAVALLAALGLAKPALADTQTVTGGQLVLTDTLSDEVIISTDETESGSVRVSLDGSVSCLTLVSGSTAVVSTSRCGSDVGRLRIEISPDMPVTISSASDETVHVGDLRAPLVASFTGSGDLKAGRTGGLVLALHGHTDVYAGEVDGPTTVEIGGANDVRIKQVNGALTVKQVSSGDLVVGGIAADSVTLDASGSGDMLIGSGHIDTLTARLHGHGDLAVAATMRNATVEATGGGDVKLGPVSGQLIRNAGGGSDITVGGSEWVRSQTGEAERRSSGTRRSVSSSSSHVIGHILAFGFVVLVLYIIWRIVRRGGGVRGRFGGSGPTVPTNPAVVALGETLARLDQRLGRVEEYVTTREFDLNRKFREL
jgi:hypothetical protein